MHSTRRLLMVAAAVLSLIALAPSVSAASPRSGDLHVTKECSQYTGAPGGYCTVTSSNIAAIAVGSKIIYRDALTFPITDTDLVLDLPGPGNNMAFGHVTEDLVTASAWLRSGVGPGCSPGSVPPWQSRPTRPSRSAIPGTGPTASLRGIEPIRPTPWAASIAVSTG